MMTEVLQAGVTMTEVQEVLMIDHGEATRTDQEVVMMTDQGEVMMTDLVEGVMMIGTEGITTFFFTILTPISLASCFWDIGKQ